MSIFLVFMYVCVCVCMYVCVYMCMYERILYVCMYVRMCVCVYVCMYVCIYVYVFFLYIIKYAPSPGSDTTYYNVSSYTFLFMGRGCTVCLCSRRRTLHSLYSVYSSIGIS